MSGQSRKPIDSMTLYDGGVLEIYTETKFKGKDTLNIPAKYEKKKVKTVQMLSQLEQTSYYLKHIVLEDGIEELGFQGCPNLETVVFAINKENRYAPFQEFEEANYNICY